MSAIDPTTPAASTSAVGQIHERRLLVVVLAALEGALLLAATLLAYFFAPRPVPVSNGVWMSGTTTYGPLNPTSSCPQPVEPGTTVSPYPCPPTDTGYQTALLIAAICAMLALLVMPFVIGFVSRRWQSALAAPTLPLWAALVIVSGVALATSAVAYDGYGGTGLASALSIWSVSTSLAGPALSALFLVAAFGGLGWLVRRAFAR